MKHWAASMAQLAATSRENEVKSPVSITAREYLLSWPGRGLAFARVGVFYPFVHTWLQEHLRAVLTSQPVRLSNSWFV